MPAQLRFSDVDRFGHVNNNIYFSLFDMCKTKYLMDVIDEDIFEKIAIVVVHTEADFRSPIHYKDDVTLQTAIVHLGNKSYTLLQRAINTNTREVKCECKTIMVCLDFQTNEPISIPEYFREAVDKFEPGL